jgi:hypothetical protein
MGMQLELEKTKTKMGAVLQDPADRGLYIMSRSPEMGPHSPTVRCAIREAAAPHVRIGGSDCMLCLRKPTYAI